MLPEGYEVRVKKRPVHSPPVERGRLACTRMGNAQPTDKVPLRDSKEALWLNNPYIWVYVVWLIPILGGDFCLFGVICIRILTGLQ